MSQANNNFDFELLVSLTSKLTALIAEETQCLKLMKISGIAALQAEKNIVAGELEKQQRALRSSPDNRASLSDEQKATLKAAAIEFDGAIQSYQAELYKAKKVNELIIGKMLEIVNEHVMKNRPYGSSGAKTMSGMELAKNTPAMKFNEQA